MPVSSLNLLTNVTFVTIIWPNDTREDSVMIIKTRVFELANGKYHNLSDLARAMELSVSQVYRVREGKRSINQKFTIGAKIAFPECRLDELFYLDSGQLSGYTVEPAVTTRYHHIIQRFTTLDL